MAMTVEDTEMADAEAGYLSDESDFYGTEDTKRELNARVAVFTVTRWLKNRTPTLMEEAAQNLSVTKARQSVKLFNAYEGLWNARMLDETVDEFLRRLSPVTVSAGATPWIYIWNPYHARTDKDPDEFKVIGNRLLEQLSGIKETIEMKMKGKTKATITKAVNIEKEKMVQKILSTAIECEVTSGKWMLFPLPEDVSAVWAIVAKAVANNELGTAAKIATNDGDTKKGRLICVYTKHFGEVEDIARVAKRMQELGLIAKVQQGRAMIHYKPDVFTHLGITGQNEWGIKPSLYNSRDVLEQKANGKLESFFCKKDAGDWKMMEC